MKKIFQVILGVVIIGLCYVLFEQIKTPMSFQETKNSREAIVIQKIKDIRSAQRAYKAQHMHYTADFDSLISFVLNDSIVIEKAVGSADDSVAVAKGQVKIEKFLIAAIDTVFGERKLTPAMVRNLDIIPFSNNTQFILDAGMFTTDSKVIVPVFECKAPYKAFLMDLDEQELVNFINERANVYMKYPGIKVGAMNQATNDAGNWE